MNIKPIVKDVRLISGNWRAYCISYTFAVNEPRRINLYGSILFYSLLKTFKPIDSVNPAIKTTVPVMYQKIFRTVRGAEYI